MLTTGQAVLEFLFAAWLLSGLYVQLAHRLAVGLVGVFTVYTGWLVFRGALSCGCFGEVKVSPWLALALDFGMLAGLIGFPPPSAPDRIRGWPLVRSWVVGGSITVAVAWILALTSGWPQTSVAEVFGVRQEVLEPRTWVNQTFPLLPQISVEADLSSGSWIVVLHRPGCSACKAIHKEYENLGIELGKRKDGKCVAFVEVPWSDDSDKPSLRRNDLYAVGRLSDDRKWFVETPVVIELKGGRVVSVLEHPEPGSAARFAGLGR